MKTLKNPTYENLKKPYPMKILKNNYRQNVFSIFKLFCSQCFGPLVVVLVDEKNGNINLFKYWFLVIFFTKKL